ncbi:MAG: branched-chain amino acid ABC transporter permease [Proteobacteria bacterium]|nr:branched-chain amino acid ABC transporter permease [Pseudomonadota bacterium]
MEGGVFLQTLVSGLFIGFVYALIAVGLTMIFGVMDIVNFAHGEYLMVAMYFSFWGYAIFGMDPLYSLPLVVLLLFILGVISYYLLIKRVINAPMLSQIFVTFGLLILLRGLAQFLWKVDYRMIPHTVLSGNIKLLGIYIGLPQLVSATGAVICNGLILWFLKKTKIGMALEAVAEDKEAARLMGINSDRMFALACGIGIATVGVAGALLASYYYVFPEVGGNFGLIAFVVIALGGFGSVVGAFIAGILVGLVEVVSGYLFAPTLKFVFVLALYLAVVFIRPQGLMGKA